MVPEGLRRVPAIVRHIELSSGIPTIDIPIGYSRVVGLVTLDGVPVGEIDIRTDLSKITSTELSDYIVTYFSGKLLQQRLKNSFPAREETPIHRLPSVDAVICSSGERVEDLKRAVQSVQKCDYPHLTVTLVDNSKTEAKALEGVAQEFGIRYVREARRGLDFARNAGIEASDADIVAFIDDDVVVEPNWAKKVVQPFLDDVAIACVTGLTMPMEIETQAQELFECYSTGGFRRGIDRKTFDRFNTSPVAAGRCGAGANMAFRRSVFPIVGLFDEALDCGTPARAGGDTDMFYRLLRQGYKVCYEPTAIAWHKHRQEMHELRKQLYGYSIAVYAFLTKCLVEYHDWSAIRVGLSWFRNHHIRCIRRCLLGRYPIPLGIVLAEVKGAFQGPFAYRASKAYAAKAKK